MKNTFHKAERLKRQKNITRLFEHGKRIKEYPLLLIYSELPEAEYRWQAAFSVPKRKFKSAVKRNTLKRRMKEAFRLCKSPYQKKCSSGNEAQMNCYALMFIYIAGETLAYDTIESAMQKILKKLHDVDANH